MSGAVSGSCDPLGGAGGFDDVGDELCLCLF